ncbi:hypothetical protein TNCV_4139801 [Trichonephila clavipes]|nr:hypothetical protein TNCV_4139801 [Trichonephila clavipes]
MGTVQSAVSANNRRPRRVYQIAPYIIKPGSGLIRLKKQRLVSRDPRFVVDHTFEELCEAASKVDEAMASELRAHAAAIVVELFEHTLVVLQTYLIINSGLEM